MTVAKINNQFDYITLSIKFDGKKTFNLTRSRYGLKVSGTEATKSSLEFFDAWFKARKDGKIGDSMQYLCDVANSAKDMADFLKNAKLPEFDHA